MVSIPFALGGFPLYSTAKPGNNNIVGNDKILVLVQLQGGNDGLSTIYLSLIHI